MNNSICVIILNYKTPGLVIDCLRSIEREVTDKIKVVVIDNDSRDGSEEHIRQAIKEHDWLGWADVVSSGKNGGFAYGNNYGIRKFDADAYLLTNSDVLIKSGLFKRLGQLLSKYPDVGVIGPENLDENGKRKVSAFRFITPLSELLRSSGLGIFDRLFPNHVLEYPITFEEQPIEVEWVGFACALIRKEVFETVGYLDENYFMYFEDVDMCRRAREYGWRIMYDTESSIIHYHGVSSGLSDKNRKKISVPDYYYRSRSRYFRTYYGYSGLILANIYWYIGAGVGFIARFFGRGNAETWKREYLDNWIGFFSR